MDPCSSPGITHESSFYFLFHSLPKTLNSSIKPTIVVSIFFFIPSFPANQRLSLEQVWVDKEALASGNFVEVPVLKILFRRYGRRTSYVRTIS